MNLHDRYDRTLLLNVVSVGRRSISSLVRRRFSRDEFWRQAESFSIGSLPLVLFSLFFVGIILILEYSFHMKLIIGNDELIPSFATMMLVRELTAIVTALLLTSRMGASTAAELGAMKNSEQLDAYRLLGTNPIDRFIAPRILACTLACVLLTFLALGVSILGAALAATIGLGFEWRSLGSSLALFTSYRDFLACGLKSLLFGVSIPLLSATIGLRARPGAEGVGRATTEAVVVTSLWIIFCDFLLTYALAQA